MVDFQPFSGQSTRNKIFVVIKNIFFYNGGNFNLTLQQRSKTMEIESLELDPNASSNMSCLLEEEKESNGLSSKMISIKKNFFETPKQDPMQQPMQAVPLGERVHGEYSISASVDSDGNKEVEAEIEAQSEDEKTEVSATATVTQDGNGNVSGKVTASYKKSF